MRKNEKVRKRAIRTSRHTFFNEIKYLLEGLTNRFDAARKTISELRLDLKERSRMQLREMRWKTEVMLRDRED